MNQPQPLNEKDLKAIELKYLGSSYQDIANVVGVELGTVKSWFMRSGRLYNAYREFSVAESKACREKAGTLYTLALERAVRTMSDLLESDDEKMRFIVAREIIKSELTNREVDTKDQGEITLFGILKAQSEARKEAEIAKNQSLLARTF